MELEEMKSLWQKNNNITQVEIKINRKEMEKKLRKSLDSLKMKRLFNLIITSISLPLILFGIVFPMAQNDGSIGFYISMSLFLLPVLGSFIVWIYYYSQLLKIESSDPVLDTQKRIFRLESFQKRFTQISFLFVPVAFICLFKIANIPLNEKSILFGGMVLVVTIIGYMKELKWRIPNEFKKIKSNIQEFDDLENNE